MNANVKRPECGCCGCVGLPEGGEPPGGIPWATPAPREERNVPFFADPEAEMHRWDSDSSGSHGENGTAVKNAGKGDQDEDR